MRRFTTVLPATAAILMLAGVYTLGAHHALTPPRADAADACRTFTETKHTVCGLFLQYWNDHGGLAQQGFPISEPLMEVSGTDGKTYQVQYFERAVFELHPELNAPNNVLLSLLGSQKYQAKYSGTPAPVASIAGTSTVTVSPTATIPVMATAVPTVAATATATTVPATATAVATAKPTAASTAASMTGGPPAGDDEAYKAYLKQKFANVGSHKILLEDLTIFRSGSGANASVSVSFKTTLNDGVDYFNDHAPKADLTAWGTALLADLKAKYPNTFVIGTLESTFYADTYDSSTDCTYTSDSYTDGQGWYTALYYVKVSYLPTAGGDKVRACFGA